MSVEAYKDAVKEPVTYFSSITIPSASYAANEFLAKPREIAPWYFEHIGNTCVSFWTALGASALAIHAAYKYSDPATISRDSKLTKMAGLTAGIASSIVAETPGISERVTVTDSKDLLFGIAGAALGSVIFSYKGYRESMESTAKR